MFQSVLGTNVVRHEKHLPHFAVDAAAVAGGKHHGIVGTRAAFLRVDKHVHRGARLEGDGGRWREMEGEQGSEQWISETVNQ